MGRVNYIAQSVHFLIFQVIQIPLLYKLILFDRAFGFFYIGFILLLPYGLGRSITMLVAMACGLMIDVFSSTPGIHASACIFIAFIRDLWFNMSVGVPENDLDINLGNMTVWGFIKYAYPLVMTHHFIIFTIENGGFEAAGILLNKIVLSSVLSFLFILAIAILLAPRRRRL